MSKIEIMVSLTLIFVLSLFGVTYPIPLDSNLEVSEGISILETLTKSKFPPITPRQLTSCNVVYSFAQSGITGVLSSVGYPGNYPAGATCNYDITSPVGTTMTVLCNDFLVPCGSDAIYVALSGDKTFQVNSSGYCGQGVLRATTIGNSLYMSLRSSAATTAARRYQCSITVQGTVIG